MKSTARISGAVATASLALTVAGCADAPSSPTPAALPASAASRESLVSAAGALDAEGARLSAAVRSTEQRARLTLALDRLSRAMDAGNVGAARQALDAARDGLRYVESDADRDALSMTLDGVAAKLDEAAR